MSRHDADLGERCDCDACYNLVVAAMATRHAQVQRGPEAQPWAADYDVARNLFAAAQKSLGRGLGGNR